MDKQDQYADRKAGGYATHKMQLGQDEHPRDRGNASEDGYVICPVQLDAEPMDDQSDTQSPMLDPNVTAWMEKRISLWHDPSHRRGRRPVRTLF